MSMKRTTGRDQARKSAGAKKAQRSGEAASKRSAASAFMAPAGDNVQRVTRPKFKSAAPAKSLIAKKLPLKGVQRRPAGGDFLAEARARAAAIPGSFFDWLDRSPGLPEGEPEVIGPRKAGK